MVGLVGKRVIPILAKENDDDAHRIPAVAYRLVAYSLGASHEAHARSRRR
jgi:hypothetical protein